MNRLPRSSRKKQILTIAAVAAVLIAMVGAFIAGQPGNDHEAHEAHEPGSIEAVAQKLAEGQARERAELDVRLVEAAEVAHGHLSQVLQELASAVPLDGSTAATPASQSDVDRWKSEALLATAALNAVEEGTSEQTVVREAFIGATHLIQSAADSYGHLLARPAGEREDLATTIADRRDAAVHLWQGGAGHLDTLTIESGAGHVHVFLVPNGDPDAVPEEFKDAEGPK